MLNNSSSIKDRNIKKAVTNRPYAKNMVSTAVVLNLINVNKLVHIYKDSSTSKIKACKYVAIK